MPIRCHGDQSNAKIQTQSKKKLLYRLSSTIFIEIIFRPSGISLANN